MKALIKKYSHAWVLLYFIFYITWFTWLERVVTTKYTIIHLTLDDYIPFCEIFVIPYFLWFAYIFLAVAYFFFKDRSEFYRITAFLFIGMTICLITYTIWPNGHDLRPNLDTLGRSNIFTRIMGWLYSTDTCTNVCPSIHAFNSIGACIAIYRSRHLKEKRTLRIGTLVLTILICMSTVFLKQHSIFDVACACLLSLIMYVIVYVPDYRLARRRARSTGAI
ncbi:MAG: phosphatase PAP2 family protein [Lachnospiraceae bacterium]|nr:phosphatase PAP2 family protein [Lachnospiraceae bacterium]